MSVDLSPETTRKTPRLPQIHIRQLLVGMAILLVLSLIGVGLYLTWPRFIMPPPVITGFTTGHGLQDNRVIGETRVFDQGERVLLVFDLAGGRPGHVVSVEVDDGRGADKAVELTYVVQRQDNGNRAVVFTPSDEGVYTATLLLDATPVEHSRVVFHVVEGGPHLQNVTTAPAVDSETFTPIAATTRFTPHDKVFITYRAVDVQPGDRVTIRYTINGILQPSESPHTIEFEQPGNFRGTFSFQGDLRQLSVGDYRTELFYNDELVAVANFEVVE